jgi:Tol biopolymer transport system component
MDDRRWTMSSRLSSIVYRQKAGTLLRFDALSNNPANDYEPAWSPDGKRIAFTSTRTNQNGNIYLMNADGTDQKPVASNDASNSSPTWSPDGKWLGVAEGCDAKLGIYVMDVNGANQTPVVNDAKDNFSPAWRP